MMLVKAGSTDVTTYFHLRLAADGTDATGLTIANIDLTYVRTLEEPAAKVDAQALADQDTAHTDNFAIEVDGTNMPGVYRVDWPDAAFAANAREVILTVKCATVFTESLRVQLQQVTADVTHWRGTAAPAEHTAGYPIVTIKDGTGTGEIDTTSGGVLVAAIAANAITATAINTGAITAAKFAAGAIDAAAIADGAIDAATFAAGAITATVIADGAIDAATFAANAITSTVIADNAVTAAKIANGAIDAATFAADVDAEILSYIVDDATRIDASALNTASGTSIPAILEDTGTTLQGELDGIQADTEDIQSRLPAALGTGGNIKADVRRVNDIAVDGAGTEGDPWGPA